MSAPDTRLAHTVGDKVYNVQRVEQPPAVTPTTLDATLSERGKRYGKFTGHAKVTQDLKRVMHATDNWQKLSDDQKEALEMVAHKIGRILNKGSDFDYHDNFTDIAGYAKLVADRLNGLER